MDELVVEVSFFYQPLEEEVVEHQHLDLVPPFDHERHECRHGISSHAEDTRASWKGPLDGARDPPSFSAGVVDPAHSSRDVPVNLTM